MTNFKYPSKPIVPIGLPLVPEQTSDVNSLESSVSEDFVALIKKEMGAISVVELTAEVFVDRVNTTHSLRYYFQEPTEKELTNLGFYRQGYWLRARPGSENLIVSIPKVAGVLRTARLRTIKLQRRAPKDC